MLYRQGDVLLKKIDVLPDNLKPKDKILAYGEVTGHNHKFTSEQVLVFEDVKHQQFVDVKEEAILEHEEHKHITIPKGLYEVVIQREFDIFQGVRQVLD